jgi:hypothetical protein
MEADADTGMQLFDIFDTYRKRMDEETRDINRQRAEALFKAADDNENNLYETQLQIGQELAKDGDYSILGKLYGWTQDQIDRVQGTGAYAPKRSSGGGTSSGGKKTGMTLADSVDKLIQAGASENTIASYIAGENMWDRHS